MSKIFCLRESFLIRASSIWEADRETYDCA